ncbi:MAG: peptidylglycine alpha-amidating monooxygenase [Labilithrix sp.]|nr:peptidylglycine alpha-amidating monooxygenase [Labilithrix sp.]MCW5813229.1 peptidylglycine alpha-amidating monooxygenase [Labilithrix sp.]
MRGWILGLVVFVSACLAVAGCALVDDGGSGDSDDAVRLGTPPGNGLPCDVEEVLQRNCGTCHGAPPIYGAPMPLVTWEQMQAPSVFNPSQKVFQAVSRRIHSTTRPMPPSGVMSAADLAIVDGWIAAGMPRNDVACVAPDAGADAGGDAGLGCTPDQTLVPPTKWTAAADVDDEYVCYGIDVPNDQKRHAIAITPIVDNPTILHHMDLFQAPESYGPEPRACSPFANGAWRMMYAWAPGGRDMVLPAAAGFPLEGTTHYVVQIHYANPSHAPDQKDGSGFGVCTTTELRANDADVMAFGSEHFTVPPRSNYALTCNSDSPSATGDIHIFGMMPHLHDYGTSMTTTLARASGEVEPLAETTHWDINNQPWFAVDATVKPGDKVRTRCTWQNDTDRPISFGDSALEEMCYAFTMYYPRVTAPGWKWSTPAETAACAGPPPPDGDGTH